MIASSKADVLSEADMAEFDVPALFWSEIERFAAATGRDASDLRFLDWGCGRGRAVAALLARGCDAYGIDIDTTPIENGAALFKSRGLDPDRRLIAWDGTSSIPFPDQHFDVILSDQVLEHVEPIARVSEEIARLSAPGALGLHLFPGCLRVVEPHLMMPFVHWLPKNRIRYWYIRLMLALQFDPEWSECKTASTQQRAQVYYRYSCDRTYYRSPSSLRRILRRQGMTVTVHGIPSTRWRPMQLFWGAMRRIRPLNGSMHYLASRLSKTFLITVRS
jgi:SAM-dependent methyltransferase